MQQPNIFEKLLFGPYWGVFNPRLCPKPQAHVLLIHSRNLLEILKDDKTYVNESE